MADGLTPYHTFSKLYDHWMDPVLYEKWAEFFKKRVSAGSSVLDLGCGTGHLGVHLTKDGYSYTGIDISEDMLTLAKVKQDDNQLEFPLILRDMCDLSDLGHFDAIVSFCDTLCYLKTPADVQKVFAEVYNHLNIGGYFLFDVHSLFQMEQFDGFSYHDKDDKQLLLWDTFAGDEPHSCEHYLTILKQKQGRMYERYDEMHYERTYPLEQLKEWLYAAGFTQIKCTANFTEPVTEKSLRIFFEVRK